METFVTCPGCGDELRDGEDCTVIGEHAFHVDCAAPHHAEPRPHHLWWSFGVPGQMALSAPQTEDPG